MKKDYKELYEKIINSNWFKKAYQDKSLGECPIVVEELEESEDERIRSYICLALTDVDEQRFTDFGITLKDCLAYLEKQKKQKPVEDWRETGIQWSPSEGEMGVLYKLCYISSQITDEDDTELTRLYQDLKREYFGGHSFENMFSNKKQKEQKPVYEDEYQKMLADSYKCGKNEVINNPEKYGLQKPAEWSEEDENRFRNLIYLVERSEEGRATKEGFISFINRLKSLHPQPHWKPSEEQMKALLNADGLVRAYNYPENAKIIASLYEQLKKL